MSRKHDIKQFRQACKELRFTPEDRYEASAALHAEKTAGGVRRHMTYGELVDWLREWRRR